MNKMRFGTGALILTMAMAAAACGSDDTASNDATGAFNNGANNGAVNNGSPIGAGVGQSGAQDFGRFRSIVDSGQLPAPETLDAVGFFNEHKVELPTPECNAPVCAHALFGVQGNMISGNNCSVVLLGTNTALNADDFARPPLNIAIAVDVSGSMGGSPIEHVRSGLIAFVDALNSKDTVSLIGYSSEARLILESDPVTDPDREQLREEILALRAGGGTNLYGGLKLALERADALASNEFQNRVILLSDGVATAGITDRERIINLGATYSDLGIGVTTIGVGDDFDLDVMQRLSEAGAGNFYFVEDLGAVEEVFTEEANTFLIPLANDVNMQFDTSDAYDIRAVYGTRQWETTSASAHIFIPSMFMAGRTRIDDIGPGEGRRGGGGMILLELIPTADAARLSEAGPGSSVGELSFTYQTPGGVEPISQTIDVLNPVGAGVTPEEGEFESAAVEKGFVTLNIYAGFMMALERASVGSPTAALNVLAPLIESVELWNEEHDDPDIESDLEYMKKLALIIEQRGGETERIGAPPNPWPRD